MVPFANEVNNCNSSVPLLDREQVRLMRVAVELAEQSISVLLGPVGKLQDEVLNLFPAGLSECLCAAEIDGIGLDQFRVELVLADDVAETVADLRSAVAVRLRVLRRELLAGVRNYSDLLDRADADSVGLAQSAVDGASFGDAHLGTTD